jgi:hypothetical protein
MSNAMATFPRVRQASSRRHAALQPLAPYKVRRPCMAEMIWPHQRWCGRGAKPTDPVLSDPQDRHEIYSTMQSFGRNIYRE